MIQWKVHSLVTENKGTYYSPSHSNINTNIQTFNSGLAKTYVSQPQRFFESFSLIRSWTPKEVGLSKTKPFSESLSLRCKYIIRNYFNANFNSPHFVILQIQSLDDCHSMLENVYQSQNSSPSCFSLTFFSPRHF